MTFLALSSSFEAFDVIECVHAVTVLYYELIVYYPFTPKISLGNSSHCLSYNSFYDVSESFAVDQLIIP